MPTWDTSANSRFALPGLHSCCPRWCLNYFGQGALLLHNPQAIANPFYLLAPGWALIPMVLLATAATVIASQAVISGAFSIANQSVQMGFLPRMEIRQTSDKEQGQIYVPLTNWTLFLAVIFLVFTFQSSSNLAAAYGIAVTGTMTITTILIAFVIVLLWRWPLVIAIPVISVLLIVDLTYFAANTLKISQGGWFPLGVALVSFTVLTTWKRGRKLVFDEITRLTVPLHTIIDDVDHMQRVSGTAVFLTPPGDGAPSAMLHNLKHNHVLHERNVLLTVVVEDKPYVTRGNRFLITDLGKNFYRVKLFYGFMQTPDIPFALELCGSQMPPFDMMTTSFFVSRALITSSAETQHGEMARTAVCGLVKKCDERNGLFQDPGQPGHRNGNPDRNLITGLAGVALPCRYPRIRCCGADSGIFICFDRG